ncbi:MAG: hypothetical protein ABL901_14185 [Hyphomicrobiaceae bacterium]
MAALTKDRSTPSRDGDYLHFPVKGGVKIFAGAIAVHTTGFAKPGITATGLIALGRADGFVDNTNGADGDTFVRIKRKGAFRFDNLSTDLVPRSHIGLDCYIVDDATVASTDGAGTRSIAGKVADVDDDGVWVSF